MTKFYITTSIPYVNAEPHVGFGMELVQADTLARYWRQQGAEVVYSTGTDEHGGKIAEKAAEKNLTPQNFTDQVAAKFMQVLTDLEISNDRFIRTTDPNHEKRAQAIWQRLSPNIYKGKYTGWYCTGDETYFTEAEVKANKGVCPSHNRPYEKVEEENYFFKLSNFSEQIKQAVESDAYRVFPEIRKNEIMSLLKSGLDDISISRPSEKIGWGVPVPDDPSHTMYVWFEALLNYITVLGYPEHADFKKFWPADVQVVGKDILRFHAAIWPGILLALNLPLPKSLFVHGFVTIDRGKISKSLGNVVSPKEVIDRYGADVFRYYFLRHIPSYGDGDFSWERLDSAYNDELADQLGNAVGRVAAMITKYQDGIIGDMPEASHDVSKYHEAIKDCRFDRALEEIWEQVKGVNQYVDESKPWEIAKSGDTMHLQEVLAYSTSCLVEIASLLVPFMPATANAIIQVFSDGKIKPLKGTLFPKAEKAHTQNAAG